MANDIPRRNQLELNTPAELAIRNAMSEVEKMGADVKLTSAIVALNQAFILIADYTDIVNYPTCGN